MEPFTGLTGELCKKAKAFLLEYHSRFEQVSLELGVPESILFFILWLYRNNKNFSIFEDANYNVPNSIIAFFEKVIPLLEDNNDYDLEYINLLYRFGDEKTLWNILKKYGFLWKMVKVSPDDSITTDTIKESFWFSSWFLTFPRKESVFLSVWVFKYHFISPMLEDDSNDEICQVSELEELPPLIIKIAFNSEKLIYSDVVIDDPKNSTHMNDLLSEITEKNLVVNAGAAIIENEDKLTIDNNIRDAFSCLVLNSPRFVPELSPSEYLWPFIKKNMHKYGNIYSKEEYVERARRSMYIINENDLDKAYREVEEYMANEFNLPIENTL